jgi:hypothetical protein
VELIATIRQARPGSGKFMTNGFKIKTAGIRGAWIVP